MNLSKYHISIIALDKRGTMYLVYFINPPQKTFHDNLRTRHHIKNDTILLVGSIST